MAGFPDVPGWLVPLASRALYLWVRTSVFPEQPQALGLDPSKPVCYVLQDEHLSNLLVLFREAPRAGLPPASAPLRTPGHESSCSVFALNRRHNFTTTARERYAHPPQMTALIREALVNTDLDVQIVPVVILWGRRPDKQESILKALFSETWQQTGRLGRLLTILLHGRNVLVRFSQPISLHAISDEELDEAQAVRKLSRVLRVHFRRQREMAIGPDLSHRNTQIETLLAAPAVVTAITNEASRQGRSLAEVQQQARHFALEIASDYSYGVLRALELFLSWLWSRLYDDIEIHNIDVVTRIAPGQGVVYVPSHRSHIDYLILSFFLHKKGLTPPHIAAGANLNMALIGPLLRRCGAFFLRRSFKGEPLYAAVFHEYLHLILTRGFPLEYFIEGGRSRSGRTLPPKAGILGMTISSFIREHNRPLVFVPVYLGYEKILEGKTYLRELSGKPKQKESVWTLLQTVRQIKKEYGRVHVNFGEPLELAGFLESCRPNWQPPAPSDIPDNWPREATRQAATALATRLNDAVVVGPINLIALTLLATPKYTADEQVLYRLLGHYQALMVEAPYSPATVICPLDPPQVVAYAERLGNAERVAHPLGDLIRIPEGKAPLLSYFRNNVLHLFALPALIACLMNHNRQLSAQRIGEAVSGMYGLMRSELFLRWTGEEVPAATAAVISVLVGRRLLLQGENGQLLAPEPNAQEFAELWLIGETLRPVLERHFLALALLQQYGSGRKTRQMLENDCHLLAQRLALLYASDAPEYSEKSAFSALVAHLIDTGLLREDDTGLLNFDERIITPLEHAELVLPAEARQAIRRMAGTRQAND